MTAAFDDSRGDKDGFLQEKVNLLALDDSHKQENGSLDSIAQM